MGRFQTGNIFIGGVPELFAPQFFIDWKEQAEYEMHTFADTTKNR